MEKNKLTNNVLITGANRGMGLGYVRDYLKKGYSVVVTAKNPSMAEELAELQKEFRDRLSLHKLDVTDEKAINDFVDQLMRKELSFSIVINNAGIAYEEEFGKWTMATFEKHFRVNTIGPALVSQAISHFLEKGAKIIQISSGMGSLEWNINPENGLDAYSASKSALHSITIRLAEKLRAQGIMVVAINPGWVRTAMGGTDATSSVEDAVEDITKTIDALTLDDSGRFLSEKGASIPW
ncbi:MAG: SDR family oxidoreductase [Aurantibacter sp.]